MLIIKTFIASLVISNLAMVYCIQAATSIEQNGITLNFNGDYQTGQFVNGDHYIVAPSGVVINSISPVSVSASRDVNGCMINPSHPGGAQGYDEYMTWIPAEYAPYIPELNAALNVSEGNPLTVPYNSSLVCVISNPNDLGGHNPFTDMAVFTILQSVPPEGSFRPGYMGTDKTITHTTADIHWEQLKTLTPADDPPTFEAMETLTAKVWYEAREHWVGGYFRAINNIPTEDGSYGENMSNITSRALLLLNCNYSNAAKQTLLYNELQYAIDISNVITNGITFPANGGHGHGRKGVLTLGAKVFQDNSMLAQLNYATNPVFGVDLHIWEITESDYSRTVSGHPSETRGVDQYTAAIPIGTPEWGFDHIASPAVDNAKSTAVYRSAWLSNLGGMLSTLIMGAKDSWGRNATFKYASRVREWARVDALGDYGGSGYDPWVFAMWDTYRSQYDRKNLRLSTGDCLRRADGSCWAW